jgi:4-hydroxy-tetrahydrodipicolinate synthase
MAEGKDGRVHHERRHEFSLKDPMKRKLLFRGTGTALVTPFKPNGAVDEVALRDLVDFQIKGGVEALLPTGTTGESVTLSEEEQFFVVETVIDQARGRVKVIPGVGGNATNKVIQTARRMADLSIDGMLSVAPYYNKPTQDGFYQHYAAIADAIDSPIVVYNVPGRTASNISAETTLRIAEEIPTIAGVKEASGNFSQIMEILRNRPTGFAVWSGDDAITLPLVALGADGVVSVVSNEVPKLFSDMVHACLKGNFEKGLKIHNRLLPLMEFNFVESNPIPVKAALAMMGFIEEQYRLPLVSLSDRHRPSLMKILQQLGLID